MKKRESHFAKSGQAALEFLITYGWAFLIILVMIGALAHFGILSPNKLIPQSCIAQYPFECTDVIYHSTNAAESDWRDFARSGIVVMLKAQSSGMIIIDATSTKISDSISISDPNCEPGIIDGGVPGLLNSVNNKDGAYARIYFRDGHFEKEDDSSSRVSDADPVEVGTYRFDEGDMFLYLAQCRTRSTIDAVNFKLDLDYILVGKELVQHSVISGRQKLSDDFIVDDGTNLHIGSSVFQYKP